MEHSWKGFVFFDCRAELGGHNTENAMQYILTINNPKTGWSHATDVDVTDLSHAMVTVAEKLKTNKKLQFSLRCVPANGRPANFIYDKGQFVHIATNEPVWLWLTQFGVNIVNDGDMNTR